MRITRLGPQPYLPGRIHGRENLPSPSVAANLGAWLPKTAGNAPVKYSWWIWKNKRNLPGRPPSSVLLSPATGTKQTQVNLIQGKYESLFMFSLRREGTALAQGLYRLLPTPPWHSVTTALSLNIGMAIPNEPDVGVESSLVHYFEGKTGIKHIQRSLLVMEIPLCCRIIFTGHYYVHTWL